MRLLPGLLIVLLLVFGVVLGLTVMWGATPGSTVDTTGMPEFLGGKPQGHVYTGVTAGEPGNVNPLTSSDAHARGLVLSYTHEPLLDRDPRTGAQRPAVAESFELSSDGKTCVFTLRSGIEFSDGTPVTMADVLFGWQLAQAGHLEMGFVNAAYTLVEKVDMLDDRRFRVHFRDQHFAILGVVGQSWWVVCKQFFVDRVRRKLDDGEPMPAIDSPRFAELLQQITLECGPGTGPFVLHNDERGQRNWQTRKELLLVRNEGHWRRKAEPGCWNLSGVRTLFRDPTASKNALLLGEVDWLVHSQIDGLMDSHPHLADSYRKEVYDFARLGVVRIIWNCKQPALQDARVRTALGMLVDRDEVVKILGGSARPAAALAKPDQPGYPSVGPLPFDPVAARRMLREAGVGGEGTPLRIKLLMPQGVDPLRRMAELFIGAAKDAGIEVELMPRPMPGVVATKKSGDWHGYLALQGFENFHDPFRFMHRDGLDNDGHWYHDEADELAAKASRELNPERRAEYWRQLHELAHREQPAALLVHPLVSVLVNSRIEDLEPGPLGMRPEHAWVPKEFQRP